MQVSVEAGEGLHRVMSIEVPFETVETEVENRLQSLKGRIKMDGFRPGKVPLKVVKQHYGEKVLYEVAAEVMQRSFQDAVSQENIKMAGDPVIKNEVIKEGEPLTFQAEFEIFPELTVAAVDGVSLDKIDAAVSDEDVDKMLDTLRSQHTDWNDADKAAADGDRIVVDFVGKIDGEAFEGGTANGVPVVIGSGSMIPGFEEALTGKSKDDDFSFEVPFPDDYQSTELAGKMAEFSIKVLRVEEASKPELNDEFAKKFGVEEGLDKLRGDVRSNLERELDNKIKADLKNQVMDKLIELNSFDAPASVIDEEIGSLKQSAQQTGLPPGDEDALRSEAERRVKLGMILAELVKQANIQPSRDMVTQRIESMAQDYEDPQQFITHYQSNPQLLRGIESLVVEDMVVDWIAEQATVNTINKTFDELMNPSAG